VPKIGERSTCASEWCISRFDNSQWRCESEDGSDKHYTEFDG
jgi:hypothetical protein